MWGISFFVPLAIGFPASGQFGDTFGAVNALFSGLGFAGLLFTIILQIQSLRNQTRQDRFALAIKITDDIKSDLKSVGIDAINEVTLCVITADLERIKLAPHIQNVTIITCSANQMVDLMRYCERNNFEPEQKAIVDDRLGATFLIYVSRLTNAMKVTDTSSEGQVEMCKQQLIDVCKKLFPDNC